MACGPGTVAFAFDGTNPAALAWARTRTATLVREVTAETQAAIRAIIGRAFKDGIAPRDAARLIRDLVGLTTRDALAVERRFVEAIARGVDPARAADAARKYAAKLHRRRALLIARTESMAASNAGQQELWNQAIATGQLDARMRKVWITADPCEICAPLEGETVLVTEDFSVGVNPPLHPACRCTIGLVKA